jgi:hypothetical protein
MARFAGIELTPETLQATREHFADIGRRCIEGATAGEFFVNDLSSYVAGEREKIADSLAGKNDHTFTFLQRAHWIQTGECLPLFAK